jgi:hypothetical protein
LIDAADARQRQRDAAWEALLQRAGHLAEHPDDCLPEELSSALIDQVFVARKGYESGGVLMLAGYECHKELDCYVSNSGKRG